MLVLLCHRHRSRLYPPFPPLSPSAVESGPRIADLPRSATQYVIHLSQSLHITSHHATWSLDDYNNIAWHGVTSLTPDSSSLPYTSPFPLSAPSLLLSSSTLLLTSCSRGVSSKRICRLWCHHRTRGGPYLSPRSPLLPAAATCREGWCTYVRVSVSLRIGGQTVSERCALQSGMRGLWWNVHITTYHTTPQYTHACLIAMRIN